jgi:hypothetical protein
MGDSGRRRIRAGRKLHVLRDIDDDRARAAGLGNAEGLVDDAREIVDVLDQPVVLGAGARDADRIAFLEGIRADERGRNLTGEADERDGIHQRVLQGRDGIGRARAGGDEHDADLAGGAGVPFGHVAGALLVAHEDVLDVVLLEDLVIDRQDGAARIAENMFYAVVSQRLQDNFGARHLVFCSAHRIPVRLYSYFG